jgi:hypothetical protein
MSFLCQQLFSLTVINQSCAWIKWLQERAKDIGTKWRLSFLLSVNLWAQVRSHCFSTKAASKYLLQKLPVINLWVRQAYCSFMEVSSFLRWSLLIKHRNFFFMCVWCWGWNPKPCVCWAYTQLLNYTPSCISHLSNCMLLLGRDSFHLHVFCF